MACKCTCGSCDCPQIKVTYFPNAGAAAPAVNVETWQFTAANVAQAPVVRYDVANCAAAAGVQPMILGALR